MHKVCPRCTETKPTSSFGKNRSRKDGLNVYCLPCANAKSLAYARANREAVSDHKVISHYKNIEKRMAWRRANSDRLRAYWVAYGKRYRTEKRAETRAKTRRQQAARRHAVPPWFDKAKEQAIYREAELRRLAGEDVEVDHIVPIISPVVCGLHWHGNLQIISADANRAKANKLDEVLATAPLPA